MSRSTKDPLTLHNPVPLNPLDSFASAKYFDAADDERFTHLTPEDALFAYVDGWEHLVDGPVLVVAYNPKPVDETWCRYTAGVLADSLIERFEEEYGDPEGNIDAFPQSEPLVIRLTEVVRELTAKAHVWQCHRVGSREYSKEEVLAIVEKNR